MTTQTNKIKLEKLKREINRSHYLIKKLQILILIVFILCIVALLNPHFEKETFQASKIQKIKRCILYDCVFTIGQEFLLYDSYNIKTDSIDSVQYTCTSGVFHEERANYYSFWGNGYCDFKYTTTKHKLRWL